VYLRFLQQSNKLASAVNASMFLLQGNIAFVAMAYIRLICELGQFEL